MARSADIIKCPIEIIKIMCNIQSLPSLLDLTEADEASKSIFKSYHASIFLDLLKASSPPSQLLKVMADVYVFKYKYRSQLGKSFTVAVEDIEILVAGFIRSCMRRPGSSSADCLPAARPSETEIYRIRRAFWRLKLCLASTRQQPDWSSVSIEWLNRLHWWEREEIDCASRYLERAHNLTPRQQMSKKRTFPNLLGGAPEDYLSWSPLTSKDESCFWEDILGVNIPGYDENSSTYINPRVKVDRVPISTGWEYLLEAEVANEGVRYFNAVVLKYGRTSGRGDGRRGVDEIQDRSKGWGYCFWDHDRLNRWGMLPSSMDPHTFAKWKDS